MMKYRQYLIYLYIQWTIYREVYGLDNLQVLTIIKLTKIDLGIQIDQKIDI